MEISPNNSTGNCLYVYKRGSFKGQYCNKPVYNGGDVCGGCSKRPCFKSEISLESSEHISNNVQINLDKLSH